MLPGSEGFAPAPLTRGFATRLHWGLWPQTSLQTHAHHALPALKYYFHLWSQQKQTWTKR